MEEVKRILAFQHNESKLRHALEELRLVAAGCCLQGDQDQLAKSIGYYCLCDSILRRICYQESLWFQRELRQVQLGMGQVFAAMQIYDLAEAYIFHYAMHSVPGGDSELDSELLRMANSLVQDVYFAFADQPPTHAEDRQHTLRSGCVGKAVQVLCWCLSRACDPTQVISFEAFSRPQIDADVQALFGLLGSPAFLQHYAEGKVSESWRIQVSEGLELLGQALARLSSGALAGQMFLQLLGRLDPQQAVFHTLRLACVRGVVEYAACVCAATGQATASLLDPVQTHLQQLGDSLAVFELWGDFQRLRERPALALCLYAACFKGHAPSVGCAAMRLADKMLDILQRCQGAEGLLAEASLPMAEHKATPSCLAFLRATNLLCGQPPALVVDSAKLRQVVQASKLFKDNWSTQILMKQRGQLPAASKSVNDAPEWPEEQVEQQTHDQPQKPALVGEQPQPREPPSEQQLAASADAVHERAISNSQPLVEELARTITSLANANAELTALHRQCQTANTGGAPIGRTAEIADGRKTPSSRSVASIAWAVLWLCVCAFSVRITIDHVNSSAAPKVPDIGHLAATVLGISSEGTQWAQQRALYITREANLTTLLSDCQSFKEKQARMISSQANTNAELSAQFTGCSFQMDVLNASRIAHDRTMRIQADAIKRLTDANARCSVQVEVLNASFTSMHSTLAELTALNRQCQTASMAQASAVSSLTSRNTELTVLNERQSAEVETLTSSIEQLNKQWEELAAQAAARKRPLRVLVLYCEAARLEPLMTAMTQSLHVQWTSKAIWNDASYDQLEDKFDVIVLDSEDGSTAKEMYSFSSQNQQKVLAFLENKGGLLVLHDHFTYQIEVDNKFYQYGGFKYSPNKKAKGQLDNLSGSVIPALRNHALLESVYDLRFVESLAISNTHVTFSDTTDGEVVLRSGSLPFLTVKGGDAGPRSALCEIGHSVSLQRDEVLILINTIAWLGRRAYQLTAVV
eukprot:gene32373-39150_t